MSINASPWTISREDTEGECGMSIRLGTSRCFTVFLSLWCFIAFEGAQAGETASQIVERYSKACTWTESTAMKVTTEAMWLKDVEGTVEVARHQYDLLHARDSKDCEWRGRMIRIDDEGNTLPELSMDFQVLLDGDRRLSTNRTLDRGDDDSFEAYMMEENEKWTYTSLKRLSHGAHLDGAAYGIETGKNMAEVLSENPNIVGKEEIDGIMCHIFEARGDYGTVRAWIAPEKGYNALKYTIRKTGDNVLDGKRIADKGYAEWTLVVENIEIGRIGDTPLATSGECTLIVKKMNGETSTFHYATRRSEVDLDPDFEAMEAFKIRLPNGNLIHSVDFGGVAYQFVDGKIAPLVDDGSVKAIDAAVNELQEQMVLASAVEQQPNEAIKAVVEGEESVVVEETIQVAGKIQDDSSTRSHFWIWLIPALAGVAVIVSVAIYRSHQSAR